MRLVSLAAAALAAGISSITWSAHAAGDLNVICSADPEVCDLMKARFEQQSDIKVNMVRLSAGETYAKIRAEARNPKTDIWWAGTGDPHLQAATEG
ncbi:iron ABC transporter substrate-binding protein, partial [Rhizobium sp. BR 314]